MLLCMSVNNDYGSRDILLHCSILGAAAVEAGSHLLPGIVNVAKMMFSGLSNPIMYGSRRLIDDNCHYVCLLAV